MAHRRYQLSVAASAHARDLGLSADRVEEMARSSAPFTHEYGNRRHEDYVLHIDAEGTVRGIWHMAQRVDAPDRLVEVTCPDCKNDGGACVTCGSKGTLTGTQEDMARRFGADALVRPA